MTENNDQLSILACQFDVPETLCVQQRNAHTIRMGEVVSAALHEQHSQLVLLPELASLHYSRATFKQLTVLAEPLDGYSFQYWATISKKHHCYVAFSFARRSTSGEFFITVAVVGPNGALIGHYDKLYLAQFGASMEKDYFCAGEKLFCFNINDFRLGTIVCADIRFPEICRLLSTKYHVDIILHPSAYSRDSTFSSWHSFAKTRALENQVYFASLNRAGSDYGHSIFVPPWIDNSSQADTLDEHKEQLSRWDLDKKTLKFARENYPFLQDRNSLPLSQL